MHRYIPLQSRDPCFIYHRPLLYFDFYSFLMTTTDASFSLQCRSRVPVSPSTLPSMARYLQALATRTSSPIVFPLVLSTVSINAVTRITHCSSMTAITIVVWKQILRAVYATCLPLIWTLVPLLVSQIFPILRLVHGLHWTHRCTHSRMHGAYSHKVQRIHRPAHLSSFPNSPRIVIRASYPIPLSL